MNQPAMSSK